MIMRAIPVRSNRSEGARSSLSTPSLERVSCGSANTPRSYEEVSPAE